MTIQDVWEKLNHAPESDERERLIAAAVVLPNGLSFLLEQARSCAAAAPLETIRYTDLAAELAERQEDLRSCAAIYRLRGQALRAMGRHADAIEALQTASRYAFRINDICLAAQVRIGAVDSLGMLGRYEEALALAKHLETELRGVGATQDAAKVLFNAGSLHLRHDRYALALQCYEQAGEILAQEQDATIVARIKTNCANALTQLSRVEEAIGFYEEAHRIFTVQGMRLEAAVVDTNIGYLHHVSGRYAKALAALTRAYREFMLSGREHEAARCQIDRAEAYRALNLYPEALEDYQQAIQVFARLPLDYDRARAELGSAGVLIAQDRPQEAFLMLDQASALFQAQRNRVQQAHTRLIRAYLLWSEGRADESCVEAQRAERTLAHNRLNGWAAEARFLPAQRDLDTRARVQPMHSVRRTAQNTGRGWLECRAAHALGRHYARQGKLPQALRYLRAGIATLEAVRTLIAPEEMHVSYLRDKQALYADLIETLLTRGKQRDIIEALEYVERSKSQLLREKVLAAWEGFPLSGAPTALSSERLAALRAQLSRGYHQAHTLGREGTQRFAGNTLFDLDSLTPLENAYHEALRDIELTDHDLAPALFRHPASLTAEDLRRALLPDETLIEFYIAGEEICAFIVTQEGIRSQRGIATLSEVSHAARRLRYHLQKMEMTATYVAPIRDQFQPGAQNVLSRLYDLLLRPLEAQMSTERIVLVPHGVLHGLPFHAFFDGGQYALDRWEFLYAPSAALWQLRSVETAEETLSKRAEPRETALLMGVAAPGIERVAGEVEQLAHILPNAQVFCNEKATVKAFRAHADECRILHIATHATFREDNPLFSGLRFTDDWLLARDLYDISLNCELATLSACQTGMTSVEPGDELFGLVRGFLAAGARSVAASLWPADDAATAALMVSFYTRLAQGMSQAAALRAAQQETRASYPHPYYWAAFSLIGSRR